MTQRITNKDLEFMLNRLNEKTAHLHVECGKPWKIGQYTIQWGYGGVQLHKICSAGRGVDVVSHGGYVSKRELYNQLNTLLNFGGL